MIHRRNIHRDYRLTIKMACLNGIEMVFLYSLLSSKFVEKNRSFHYIKYVPWDKTIPKVRTLVGIVFPITT